MSNQRQRVMGALSLVSEEGDLLCGEGGMQLVSPKVPGGLIALALEGYSRSSTS